MDINATHREAIIVDGVAPLLQRQKYVDLYKAGGVTCVAPTLSTTENAADAFRAAAGWLGFIDRRPDLLHVRTVDDIARAKREDRLGILFHFQGTSPFEQDLDLVAAFEAVGVRMAMLTYNTRNYVGDGCEEESDAGLSRFGRKLIEALNRTGITVDLTHTGKRTTMEAMEVSTKPVVFSHSNAKALLDVQRNIDDEQARAAARTGGLVAVTLAPYFITVGRKPTIDDFVDHLAHFANLVGCDHVGIGLDYYWGQQPFASDQEADDLWSEFVAAGIWDPATYPRPPHYYPDSLATPAELSGLTAALDRRGFSEVEILKILGANWLRVFRDTWR
ncbi:dipeptidase [Stakelama pacifica]|uniref:Membrane dipeptidase n=1 Tax=Stakelama pacifica TaxID=517720 RepID=A0A4R6FB18_9SPHN|nr:dipeptidase [Stakelama pacifica]TDN78263.1 membrane dipeptidase [Stakelama pacifica]GGO99767.1 dipeptidase [Stakelama pacifica]